MPRAFAAAVKPRCSATAWNVRRCVNPIAIINSSNWKFEFVNALTASTVRPEREAAVWQYRNPVDVVFGAGSFIEVAERLGGRRYSLVTYGEPIFRVLAERLECSAGPPVLVIDDVAPNPDMELLQRQAGRYAGLAEPPEVIVAIGGGSVIDSAKVFAAAGSDFSTVRDLLETGKVRGEALQPLPTIAVPTTAGTGSEVTCWATVWDSSSGRKHSLSLPSLYPECAIVDPELMIAKPRPLTISTGLDALSHAMESLWNMNANPVSMAFAVNAAREVLEALPKLAENLANLQLRARMARAALFAGFAFSNTKTAIAHSLSYPVTMKHGVPHGIACSFTLPMVMRSVAGIGGICRDGLSGIFDTDVLSGAGLLDDFLAGLGVSTVPADYGIADDEWRTLVDSSFNGERGRNFIGLREELIAVMCSTSAGAGGAPYSSRAVGRSAGGMSPN
ncbi:MAG: phosphonoacetaldehyde reductase [Hyphomicrobiaceae bacterium]|nr:phosphonoacetaldehyde reductase [Hyphomicrobiaceae bacterium]